MLIRKTKQMAKMSFMYLEMSPEMTSHIQLGEVLLTGKQS